LFSTYSLPDLNQAPIHRVYLPAEGETVALRRLSRSDDLQRRLHWLGRIESDLLEL
jgi:hypothetical protein